MIKLTEQDWKEQNHQVKLFKDEAKLTFKISKRAKWIGMFIAYIKWSGKKPISLRQLLSKFSRECFLYGFKAGKSWEFNNTQKSTTPKKAGHN